MIDSHAEDTSIVAAAVRPLATKKELGKSEKRLNAACEALGRKIVKEMQDRDERLREELKADLERAIRRDRCSNSGAPTFSEIMLGPGFAVMFGSLLGLGISELLLLVTS